MVRQGAQSEQQLAAPRATVRHVRGDHPQRAALLTDAADAAVAAVAAAAAVQGPERRLQLRGISPRQRCDCALRADVAPQQRAGLW